MNKFVQFASATVILVLMLISSSFGATVGNTSVLSSSTTTSYRRAMPFTMSEDGDITSITMYHKGGSGQMILAVYDDYNGYPDNRIGVTPSTTVNGSTAWQTINLTSPASVSTGETIWLAWVYESNPGIYYTSGSPGRASSSSSWSGGMPSTFGSSSTSNYIYSIYATYTTGVTAPPQVSDIPNQTINEGQPFSPITLDSYVSDPDTPDDQIEWMTSSDPYITVNISASRVATVAYNAGWTGSRYIVFYAQDTDGNMDDDGATFEVTQVTTAPTITTQPQNATVADGGTATFSVGANGNPTPSYQWYQNGSAMSGQTSSTLTVSNVTCAMTGNSYYAIASNGVPPNAQSNSATLTVSGCAQQDYWESDPNGITVTDPSDNVGIGGAASSTHKLSIWGTVNCSKVSTPILENVGKIYAGQSGNLDITAPYGTFLFDHGLMNMLTIHTDYLNELNAGNGINLMNDTKVEGTLYAREVIVTTDPYPDYVFAQDYKLKPLEEVEKYIKENNHLPGIPSEKEVKENGVNLGDVQAKLLEKIEEMTLYMIELKNRINELEAAQNND